MKMILVLAIVLFLVPLTASAQDFCEGNFDYDDDQDGSDAFTFKTDFGRSSFGNPCPPDGPVPVPKTGQTTSYATGDDGDWQSGLDCPNPRFTDNLDATITDNLNGLMWLQDVNCITTHYPEFDNHEIPGDGKVTWQNALDFVAGINDGTYSDCGGNQPDSDWRLPNIKELLSLIDYGQDPALPPGHPFSNVQNVSYWSSTTFPQYVENVLRLHLRGGLINHVDKSTPHHVWPVRGGH